MSMRGSMVRQHIAIEQSKPTEPLWRTFRRLSRFVLAHRGPLAAAFGCVLLSSLGELVMPLTTQWAIDAVIPSRDMGLVALMALILMGTASGLGFLSFGRTYLMSLVGQRVIFDLRNQLYQHIQGLSMRFFDQRRTGEIMSRVTNDVGALQQMITSGVVEIVADLLTFSVVYAYLLWRDWQLTLAVTVTMPLMLWATQRFGRRIRSAYRDVQAAIAGVNEHLQDTIASIRVVKSFANERYEIDRFSERNKDSMEANVEAVRLWAIFFPVLDLMNHLGVVTVLAFGSYQVMRGHLSVGGLVAFLVALQMLNRPVRRFGRIMNVVQQAAASSERVFEILDTEPDVVEKPGAVSLPHPKGAAGCRIEFENVRFAYHPGETVVHDFSLRIEPGRTVALVGPSGAGKTTVANLVARFYDVDEGAVRVDGFDVRDLQIHSLRSQIGIVSQEILLLHGTVKENIAYGRPGASDGEVIAAAKAAHAHEFIVKLPQGYDTVIGERGVRLSGGQRQRVAIARALLRDPRILILDEATSQLDSESEHLIQSALRRVLQGRTSLVIAHRLSTIQSADRIVVMENGRIAAEGTHERLLAAGGLYARLHALQFPAGRDGEAHLAKP